MDLGTVNGDGVWVKSETNLFVNKEIIDLLALVTLKLDHLSGLLVGNLVSIAGLSIIVSGAVMV